MNLLSLGGLYEANLGFLPSCLRSFIEGCNSLISEEILQLLALVPSTYIVAFNLCHSSQFHGI